MHIRERLDGRKKSLSSSPGSAVPRYATTTMCNGDGDDDGEVHDTQSGTVYGTARTLTGTDRRPSREHFEEVAITSASQRDAARGRARGKEKKTHGLSSSRRESTRGLTVPVFVRELLLRTAPNTSVAALR